MIRRATYEDIPRLNQLLKQVLRVHSEGRPDIFKNGTQKYSDDELREILKDDTRPVYVYEENNFVKGYAFCVFVTTEETQHLKHRKSLYIDDLCVDELFRENGIGRELYQYVEKKAQEASCDSVTLNVWSLNETAMKFYISMGMIPLKTIMENNFRKE